MARRKRGPYKRTAKDRVADNSLYVRYRRSWAQRAFMGAINRAYDKIYARTGVVV